MFNNPFVMNAKGERSTFNKLRKCKQRANLQTNVQNFN